MNSDWMKRLGIARAWILEAGAVIAYWCGWSDADSGKLRAETRDGGAVGCEPVQLQEMFV